MTVVAPGFILTEMSREGRSAEEIEEITRRAMVGRAGRPEDIAHAVAFLASPESGFITAQVLTVDGGRMDHIGHMTLRNVFLCALALTSMLTLRRTSPHGTGTMRQPWPLLLPTRRS